jgi:hypothetical protein
MSFRPLALALAGAIESAAPAAAHDLATPATGSPPAASHDPASAATGSLQAESHDPASAATGSLYVLSRDQRSRLFDSLLQRKPNPGYYAIASAIVPGAGQLALGEWQEPALVWGALTAASMGAYALCEGVVGLHPAFLGTAPFVFANGVSIPGSARCGKVNVIYNNALMLAYLAAAGFTSWRTYDLALRRRAEVDRELELLAP